MKLPTLCLDEDDVLRGRSRDLVFKNNYTNRRESIGVKEKLGGDLPSATPTVERKRRRECAEAVRVEVIQS